jgi:outer membrane protein assembly factor BamB
VFGSGDGFVYAVDAADGRVKWKRNVGAAVTGSAAVTGRLTYVTDINGELIALSTTDGRPAWRANTGKPVPFPWGHESTDYFTSSPTVANGTVVVGGSDGHVYALDARTGARRWRVPTEGRVRSSPAIANGVVYVGSFDGRLYAIDLASGKLRWRFDTQGTTLESESFGYDRRSIQASPAVVDGVVYVGGRDGRSYAIDASSGTLKWATEHDETSWVIGSPALGDSLLFEPSSDARFVHALARRDGKEVWRRRSPNTVWASPILADGILYGADGNYDGTGPGRVFALDAESGVERWVTTLPAPVMSSPAVRDSLLYVGSDDGYLYAIRSAPKTLDRVVFWDSLASPWGLIGNQLRLRDYFKARGYTVLGAADLARWMQDRVVDSAPSVVVFAIDHAPRSIAATSSDTVLLRRYLTSGGKVVWPGVPPRYWLPDSTGQRLLRLFGGTGTDSVLGVQLELDPFDRYSVMATPRGEAWGLTGWWLGAMATSVDRGLDVLARDERGHAAVWIKRYTRSSRGGFLFFARPTWDEPALRQLVFMAEFWPAPL